MEKAHRLVIIGGGVAGLDVATHLARKGLKHRKLAVTLIDRETAYVWKPMLHTVAAGTSDAGAQQTVYAAQAVNRGFHYELGEAIDIDRVSRQVRLAPIVDHGDVIVGERVVDYDTLLLAIGSRVNDFGTPGVQDHCMQINSRSEAIQFNDRLRAQLVRSAWTGETLTIGIVGGAATGVELAAQLVQVASIADHYGLAGISNRLRIVLIESGSRLLAPFPNKVADSATRKLKQLGIDVHTGVRVQSVSRDGFHVENGSVIGAGIKIWAAGVKAPSLLNTLGDVLRTKAGQLIVGPTLRSISDPNIYAVGDCASLRLPGQPEPVPTTAQAANQQARYLCRHLPQLIDGEDAPAATYRDFGSLVSLGGYDAYGTLGRFGFFDGGFIKGRIAQFGHAMLYRQYQSRLHGLCKGSLLWLVDILGHRVRPSARLS